MEEAGVFRLSVRLHPRHGESGADTGNGRSLCTVRRPWPYRGPAATGPHGQMRGDRILLTHSWGAQSPRADEEQRIQQ